ncbi:MlaC/ttg2D family ABC transporter substrate-binding protein [Marinospirillum insulare]|uniref:Phospholipid transport system substrate-binding protein n=1 Tax=Marinospirillum insulare TaxID=217169 RepID=A0ABQ5ZV51_9GAMM|nr:ABC transporter substrate-binding protein [Marinospirillum insulare]GLR63173.1 hypothetical protein GCM10007878_06080 [Marinospirillum insulare]
MRFFYTSLLLLGLIANQAGANEALSSKQVVERGIADLTEVFEANKTVYDQQPNQLYVDLDRVLQPYVNFRYISARVMGGRYFRAATPQQRTDFAATFQETLVKTFGQGLMNFDYQEFDLQIKEGETRYEDQDNIALDVVAKGGERIPIIFTLRLHADEWKIINLIVNGVNLGLTFNSQFDRAMREKNRDFDAVIANWSPEQTLGELKKGEVE